ncbi:MAG: PHP domain-containing protein [Ruminococcaceae bacterium]|nr:PHP domain-containing protein [Oscillospiraceae bacterium]
MIANYHTHTYRCRHASGSEEEYVLNSINNGIKILGFSDHAPFKFPDGSESGYRVPTDEAENYFEVISELRKKYKDQIEIHIGFEMEYYPLYFNDMLSFVKSLGAEYLILGQHFIGNERPNGKPSSYSETTNQDLKEYVDCVVAAIKTKKFSYVAHPDIFNFKGDEQIYRKEMKRICLASKKYNIPLEINFLGIGENRHYPNPVFWEVAGEVGCKAIFGCDAHKPDKTFQPDIEAIAQGIADKNGITVLKTIKLKKL